MSIPEKNESGAISGRLQQLSAGQFPTAIPIKKRKFPIIQPAASPSSKEQSFNSDDNDSKNGQQSSIVPDGKLTTNSNVIKTPPVLMIKKEFIPMNAESGASKPREAKPLVNPGSLDDLRTKQDGLLIGKELVQGDLNSSVSGQTVSVKQEIVGEQVGHALNPALSMTSLNVELSLGPKERSFLAGSEKLNMPLLSFALSKGKAALYYRNDTAIGVEANRSNWDLNTTMDTWGDSTIGEVTTHQRVGGSFSKNNESLGLKFSVPFKESNVNKENQVADKLVPTTASLQVTLLSLQPLVTTNGNMSTKIEPVDENLERKCSISGHCTNYTGLPKTCFVKRELDDNINMDKISPLLISQEKLVDRTFIKSEVVEGNMEAKKCNIIIPLQSVTQVMQHQEGSTSASTPVSLLPICSGLSRNDQFVGMISNHGSEVDSQKMLCNVGNSNLKNLDKGKSALVDENMSILGSCQPSDVATNIDEKIDIPSETHEDPFGSDSESQEMDIDEENVGNKGNEKYRGNEVQEPLQNCMERSHVDKEKFENSKLVEHSSQKLHPISLDAKNINPFTFDKKDCINKTCDPTTSDVIKDHAGISYLPYNAEKIPHRGKLSEKKFVSIASAKQPDALGKHVNKSNANEGSSNTLIDKNYGMKLALADKASGKVINEICSLENDSTLSNEDTSLNIAIYSHNIDNKSHVTNLSRSSVAETPSEKRSIPNWLLKFRYRNESFQSLDEDIQPPENRNEFFTGDAKKIGKTQIWDQSLRNSYMRGGRRGRRGRGRGRGRGRMPGQFGYPRRDLDLDLDHDFVFANAKAQEDNRDIRRKHTSSVSNVDVACSDLRNGVAFRGGRRKEINKRFPSTCRRIFVQDRGPDPCVDEDCFKTLGSSHGNKFIPGFSGDVFDPNYDHQQTMYEEVDGQAVRGSRSFSGFHGNGFPQMRSKSPMDPRRRSPEPWPFPERRSPNLPPGTEYHKRRMRSPNHAFSPDDSMSRMRGPPPYHARYPYDPRGTDSNQEHIHDLANSHRRNSPSRVFSRNVAREDMLDPREMRESNNEFVNERGSIDERRNHFGGWAPPNRPYHLDFQFYQSDVPKQHRFNPRMDDEYFERNNNMQSGEETYEHVKHHHHRSMVLSSSSRRRVGNLVEETRMELEGEEWEVEGYINNRMKRRRF